MSVARALPSRLLPSGRSLALDAAVAVGSAALVLAAILGGSGGSHPVGGSPVTSELMGPVAGSVWPLALFLVMPLGLLVRRAAPVLAVGAVFGPPALHAVITGHGAEGLFLVVPINIALYSLGAYATGGRLAAGVVMAAVLLGVHDVFDTGVDLHDQLSAFSYLFWTLVTFTAVLVGLVVGLVRRSREARRRGIEEERRHAEVVASERAKIARELHDVVTHNVNAVVLQAMAADSVLDSDPSRVRQPLAAIEGSARAALVEMRRMLGVLRDGDEQLLGPQPGIDDVPALVADFRGQGMDVDCSVSGAGDLPEGVGLVVYRVVQESLSNVMKHAHGAHAWVSVAISEDAVQVEVLNSAGAPLPGAVGAGHGLVGLAERVDLLGGTA
ncbi:MAG: hypothetical protein JOZ82_05990, partial [Marmoricola sp.]|nr:hypothetical protein [Marmoricola sp.]